MRDLWLRLLRPTVEVGPVVRRDLLVQSASASRISNQLGIGLVAVVVVLLHGAGVGRGLAVWTMLTLLDTVVFGLAMSWHIRHEPDPVDRVFRQQRTLSVVYLVCGTCWGSLALFALPSGADAGGRAVVVANVLIAMAANIAFSSATPMPFLCFHVSLMLTAALGFVVNGAAQLSLIMVFCLVGALVLQKELYLQISGAKLLARRNHLLAQELRAERAAVEQVNQRLVEANVELSHRATRDPLTGLANRALLHEQLTAALERSRPLGRSVGLIYIDLDRFKAVNDTLGHAAGDELLCQVGRRVVEVLREVDVPARLGGDEFVVLTVDGEAGAGVGRVAERLHAAFAEPFRIDGRTLRVTASLGVAVDDGQLDGEALLERADTALYRAKQGGRDRVETFDGDPPTRPRARDEPDTGPLFGGPAGVVAHFRRVLDVSAGSVAGVEVTVELTQPEAEPLTGEALRDLAARTGMTARLDEELLRRGAAFLRTLGSGRDPGFRVLARLGRRDADFDDVARFLLTDGLAEVRDGLDVAVTEGQLVCGPDSGRRIQALRDLGVRFVLDEVGRGESSLARLTTLPIDGLRLHPDVVRLAAATPAGPDAAVLAALSALAGRLGVPLAARGVDTQAQLKALQAAGVTLVQGAVVPTTQLAG